MIFYDFEVFKFDWLAVMIDPFNKKIHRLHNSKAKLEEIHNECKGGIWVGYNNRNYDQYIYKGILCDFDPKDISDFIIKKGRKGWEYSGLFNKIQHYTFDCSNRFNSLKQLEGFMGNSIKETSVPFDIDRPLTQEEIEETFKYCQHDVEQTMEVFLKTKNEFDAQMSLLNTFGLPLSNISKTQAQLASIILDARFVEHEDEWNIRMPETLQLEKYNDVSKWFLNDSNHNEENTLETDICGVPHVVAWGGLHGALNKYSYTCADDELLVMADVDQLYPTLMIRYNLLSRGVRDPKKFEEILNKSLELKRLKKKKEREPYKRICNITYGAEGDPNNAMFDPLHRKLVCVFGQVLMIDLLEKVEPFTKLIQSNTDGVLLLLKRKDFDRLDDAVYEWEQRTGLHMSFDFFKRIIQKDVNNYIAIDYDGNAKTKGAFVKKLNDLDYDMPIVNKALNAYITDGVPVEETINGCDDLREFQKIVKISAKYTEAWHNGQRLNDKTFRVFADKRWSNGCLNKCKGTKNKWKMEKFANTPDHCFIWNDTVVGVKVPDYLDKIYYIEVAKKRLSQFGL